MRKLATLRQIADIRPIPNADAIVCAVVDGWQVVVKKGEFVPGETAVFLEIDSWVPHELAPFLTKPGKEPGEFEGLKGERLRTVKLRGQISQGLLLKTADVFSDGDTYLPDDDLTDVLGIRKWERPIPACMGGQMRGSFVPYFEKTDQERIQNLDYEELLEKCLTWEVTEKIDGTSATFALLEDGTFHVCSRNYDWQDTEASLYWQIARKYDIERKMREVQESAVKSGDVQLTQFAIQGEIIGPNVQNNLYRLSEHALFMFDVQTKGGFMMPESSRAFAARLGLLFVPMIAKCYTIPLSREDLLALAENCSSIDKDVEREGLVFKANEERLSFKVISNRFLLKGGE